MLPSASLGSLEDRKIVGPGFWTMKQFWARFFAAAFVLCLPGAAWAQSKAADPSVYLRCDGNPAHRSTGELLGRALLLSATLGIAGKGEVQDVSKRATGRDGADACEVAVQQESDPVRKVQLMLARSVHHIEAGDYAAAEEDARQAAASGPATDVSFRHTLLVSALELQAAAQLRQGRAAEAEATALKMAAAAPYEVIDQVRAVPYAQLTDTIGPDKQAYLDRLVKVRPEMPGFRAVQYQWAGRYLDAAADYAAIADLRGGFTGNDAPPLPDALALRAAMLAMGGKMADAATVANDAAAMIKFLTASGKAGTMQGAIDAAEQALDFEAIVADLAAGRASAARIKFAARSHWSVSAVPTVADLAAWLCHGAAAGELTSLLAADPAGLRRDGLIANAGAITEADNANANLYGVIRAPLATIAYAGWSDDVWNTKQSYFLHQRQANGNYVGDLFVVPQAPRLFKAVLPNTIATGEALLLHAALMAEARGMKGFVQAPGRQNLDVMLVHFGNPGDAGRPATTTFDAATVIADLSPEFPDPNAKSAPPANP
jgi:hypothetical protein